MKSAIALEKFLNETKNSRFSLFSEAQAAAPLLGAPMAYTLAAAAGMGVLLTMASIFEWQFETSDINCYSDTLGKGAGSGQFYISASKTRSIDGTQIISYSFEEESFKIKGKTVSRAELYAMIDAKIRATGDLDGAATYERTIKTIEAEIAHIYAMCKKNPGVTVEFGKTSLEKMIEGATGYPMRKDSSK